MSSLKELDLDVLNGIDNWTKTAFFSKIHFHINKAMYLFGAMQNYYFMAYVVGLLI